MAELYIAAGGFSGPNPASAPAYIDIDEMGARDLEFSAVFKANVTWQSGVKLGYDVKYPDGYTFRAIEGTAGMDDLFADNLAADKDIRWQARTA